PWDHSLTSGRLDFEVHGLGSRKSRDARLKTIEWGLATFPSANASLRNPNSKWNTSSWAVVSAQARGCAAARGAGYRSAKAATSQAHGFEKLSRATFNCGKTALPADSPPRQKRAARPAAPAPRQSRCRN